MIDDKLTKEIQLWLAKETMSDDDIKRGAELLLRINRNRVLYQNICRKPQRFVSKLRYELQKHLRYRLDGLTLVEVKRMEARVLPQVKVTLNEGVPVTTETAELNDEPKRGKRADHDTLPDDIKALWDTNAERYKKMKEAYYTCLSLDMPCDRYEYVKLLAETYKLYKRDMAKYDAWTADGSDTEAADADTTKAVSSARSYISKQRKQYDNLTATGDNEAAAALKEKIQQRVTLLVDNEATMSDELTQWLTERGFNLSADEA